MTQMMKRLAAITGMVAPLFRRKTEVIGNSGHGTSHHITNLPDDIDPPVKKPVRWNSADSVIPKGSKEYFFNGFGHFSTERMPKDETAFKCVAINDKNAIRKFEAWKRSTVNL